MATFSKIRNRPDKSQLVSFIQFIYPCLRVFGLFFLLSIALIFTPTKVNAQQGCCSWHGGISHCDTSVGTYVCNDGSYSPSCGCLYIAPTPYIPPTPTFPISIQASWNYKPNATPNETYYLSVTLDDSNPTQYSATLNKCRGCNPGPLVDFSSNKFYFDNVETGTWYLNVKKRINGIWSTTVYWTIEVPKWHSPPTPTTTPTAVTTTSLTDGGSSSDLFITLLLIGCFVIAIVVSYKLLICFLHYAQNHDWVWGIIIWGIIIGSFFLFGILSKGSKNNINTINSTYTCNCSKTCPNMTCTEAYYQLDVCGCSARDGDGDGVPCEAQCR